MSIYLGNTSQYTRATVDPEKIKIAEVQYNAMSTTFNTVLKTCENKCIAREYGESELNTGEQCCVDRCVKKFVHANYTIGVSLQEKGFDPYSNMPEYQKVNEIMLKNKNEN